MKPAALHIIYVDPWVAATEGVGPDRRSAIVQGIAAGGHTVTVLAGRNQPASTGSVKRILPALSRKFGIPSDARPARGYGVRLLNALLGVHHPDVVILAHPPRKGGFAAAIFSALAGVPLILDAREVQTEKAEQGFFSRFVDHVRLSALKSRTAHVFAATPEIKTWFEGQGFPASQVSVAPDGCDTSVLGQSSDAALSVLQKYPHALRGPLAIYAGSLNRGRPVSALLEIAAAARVHAPDLNFVIVGDGSDRLDLNAFAARLDVLERNVWFIPPQPRSIVAGLLNAATLALVLPPRSYNGGLEAGSHLYEALAASKPIAVLGNGWQRELVEGRQAGVILPLGNPDAAARELADFLQSPELVRRAGEQAAALAQGKHNTARIVVEMRQTVEKIASLHSRHDVMLGRYKFAKRLFDILLSATLIAGLSPLLFLICIISLAAGWTPIAGRERAGRKGKTFKLFTFDTLKADQTRPQSWAHRFAHVLRRTALDRLPELFNVLLGQMSFVGPRALPSQYTSYYTESQLRRLDVRPGITGWAQVNGRQGFTWEEMFAHDFYYVENRSFRLDLKILGKTLVGAFKGKSTSDMPSGQLPRFDEIEARKQGAEDI
jgi:lipopolysaccharide/colanic/teichoic acid biosynthesis glycosyltransferase